MPFARSKARSPLGENELFDYAVKSLGARMQSVRDLRRKLQDRAEPGPDGDAADLTRLRQENRSLGRRRIQQDLQGKGIASNLIASTLTEAYEGVDEQALVRQHMERKRIKPPADEKSTARVLRRLTAAGFSSKTIFAVLHALKSDAAALDRAEAENAENTA